jgi:putative glutamine amidotransferase
MVCAMARPVIGICTALERARWSVWDQQAALLPRNYIDAVHAAGGLALLIPPDPELSKRPDEVLDLLDGLMLAGGADIDPAAYGAAPHAETVDTVPERDAFEIAIAREAIARELPVLGICRGMQLINVALGGTLLQHLPERFGHHEHRRVIGSFDGADHDVLLREGSLAARVARETRHSTKSHHHQGVDRLGVGLTVSGVSTFDELPEAIEWEEDQPQDGDRRPSGEGDGQSSRQRFVLGVQWHPEADARSPIVGALVAAAAARDGDRG